MIERLILRVLLLALSCNLALPLYSAEAAAAASAPATTHVETAEKPHKEFHPVVPGPADGQVAYVTAKILEKYHYLKKPFNADVSSKFLTRYLETLDPQHSLFIQSDLNEFERYRTNLD